MNQIVIYDPKELGIEANKAKSIKAFFMPMLDKMEALEVEYNKIIKMPQSVKASALARVLRMKYVKVRTGTATIHTEGKASVRLEGLVWDGWKNAQLVAGQGKESKLSDIEKYAENLEKERIAKLNEKRQGQLLKYLEDESMMPAQLGTMADDVWINYLSGVKTAYDTRIEAEKQAEKDRIKKEKEEKEERERIRLENEQLKKEAIEREKKEKIEREEREKKEKIEREEREKKEKERLAKEEKKRLAREEEERKQREAREKHEKEVHERHEKTVKEAAEKKKKEITELKAKICESAGEETVKAITHGYNSCSNNLTIDEAIETWTKK